MRILLIVHGFPPEASGGTEIYTHDLARALSAGATDDVFVLAREADPSRPEYDVRRGVQDRMHVVRINNTFQRTASLEDSYANPALLAAAETILDEVRPDIAHIQHLTCLSTGLPRALASRGVSVVMTLNDYWLLCHRGQLFDLDWHRCTGPGTSGCARCIPAGTALATPFAVRTGRALRNLSIPGAAAAGRIATSVADRFGPADTARRASRVRLEHMREAVASVDLFLAPSQTMMDVFRQFGAPLERLERCGQGIDQSASVRSARGPEGILRLGFAGSFLPSKAPHVLLEAAERLSAGTVSVDLLGAGTSYHGDDSYANQLAPLLRLPFVRQHGSVSHADVPRRLAELDALVVPSVWIENAPFVIKEAFAAGVPVVASALGGMAELVQHDVNGLLFEAGDPQSLANQLRRLQDEPGLLERLRAGIAPPMTIEQDAAELRERYARLIATRNAVTQAALDVGAAGPKVIAVVLNYCTPEQTWLAVRSLQTSFEKPWSIVVVDNGSPDGSAAALRRMFDDEAPRIPVRLIETGRNLGFPAGSNVGIDEALQQGADLVLVVNSDVVLAPDALTLLLAAARSEPRPGIVAPLIVSREEPDRVSSAGISYSMASGRMRNLMTGELVSEAPVAPFEVPAVSGCVMLIPRPVLEKAGLFDPAYFFSFEDLDICLRARAGGFRTMTIPAARAYHEGSRSIGRRSPRRIYFATRNHLRLGSVLESNRLRRTVTAGSIVALNAAYVLTSPDAPLVSGLAAVLRGAWHHLIGRYGPDAAA